MKKVILLLLLYFPVHFYGQTDFVLTFNGIDVSKPIKLQKQAFKNAVISAKFGDKNKYEWTIIGFTIKIPGIQAEVVKGNKIDDRIYNKILLTATKGNSIIISDIKTNCIKDKLGPYPDPMFPVVIEIY